MITHDGLIVNNCHASCMPQFQGSLALRGKEAKKNTVKKNTVVATLKKVLITFVFLFLSLFRILSYSVITLQQEETSSTSSSSEEGLLCVFSDSETSCEEKVSPNRDFVVCSVNLPSSQQTEMNIE